MAKKKAVTKTAETTKKIKTPWYKTDLTLGRVPTVDIVLMAKHLSVMLDAGVTVPEALDVLVNQSTGTLKRVMRRIAKRVDSGDALAEALAAEPKVFSPVFVSAVLIGENSGTLGENLTRLSTQMEKDLTVRRNIQAAMVYPIVVMTITLVLGFAVATFVLPQLVTVFRSLRVELPLSTRILMWIAEIFGDYGTWITFGTFGLIVFMLWFVRQPFMRPIVHRFVLRIPLFGGFVHDINRARFCRTLGTLLESGTPIEESLQIASDATSNVVYKRSVMQMKKEVASGENFFELIRKHPYLYPPIVQRMVAVGERSGSLGDTLNYLASFYEERVEITAKNISSLVEPIMLVFIGGMVAMLAIAILTPIYSILGGVKA
ncbi:MAG: type II secretion system F family protein [Patescibacteria group bacterium]